MHRQMISASCSLHRGKNRSMRFSSAVVEFMMTLFLAAFRPASMVLGPEVSMESGMDATSCTVDTSHSMAAGPSSRPGPTLTSSACAPHSTWRTARSWMNLASRWSMAFPTEVNRPLILSEMMSMMIEPTKVAGRIKAVALTALFGAFGQRQGYYGGRGLYDGDIPWLRNATRSPRRTSKSEEAVEDVMEEHDEECECEECVEEPVVSENAVIDVAFGEPEDGLEEEERVLDWVSSFKPGEFQRQVADLYMSNGEIYLMMDKMTMVDPRRRAVPAAPELQRGDGGRGIGRVGGGPRRYLLYLS